MSHETRDASLRVLGFGAACFVLIIVFGILEGCWFMRSGYAQAAGQRGRQTGFAVGYQREPAALDSWKSAESEFNQRLNGYSWVDRGAGIARIPIERAMALAAGGARPAPFPPGAKPPGPPPP